MSNVRAQVTADSSGFQKAMKAAVLSMKEMGSACSLASTRAKMFGSAQDAMKAKVNELKTKIAAQTDIVKLNQQQQEKLAGKLQQQKEKHAALAAQVSKAKRAYEESAEATGKNSEETQALGKELEDLKKKEKAAAEAIDRAEQSLSSQETATNKSKQALERFKGELQQLNREMAAAKWESFSKGCTKIGNVMEKTGQKMMVVTTAIAGLGAAALKTTADFDAQMSTVKSISGATGEQFDALRDKAIEMGSKTAFSASEAGQAMEYMAMAGWDTQDVLDGIAGVMDAAAASGEDLALTSDIITDGLTAFGLSAKDAGHFADVLVKTGNSANTNVAMMGETFKYCGAVCGTLGISIEDAAIATGLMGNAGIKASQAGTALRGGLTNLVKPTKQMKEAMDQYGVAIQTTDDGSVDFMATMQNVRQALGGLDSASQAAAIAQIFGKEAMSGWAAIVNATDEDFQSLTDSIYNAEGAAQEAAGVKLDNLSGQITILKSTIEGIAIQIGDILMPTVRKIVAKVQEWATAFSELSTEEKQQVVKIGAIVAAIGPALIVGGKLFKTVGMIAEGIAKLKKAGGIFTAMKAAIAGVSAPVLGVVAAVAALVGAFAHLWRTNEEFKGAIIGIWEQIKETVGGFIDGVRERLASVGITFESVTATIKTVWNGLCEFLAPVFVGAFQIIADTLGAVFDVILNILDIFISAFKGDWDGVWNGVKGVFSTVWNWIVDTLKNALNMLVDVTNVVLGWFGTSWSEIWTSVKTFFTETWTNIKTFFSETWDNIKTKTVEGVDRVRSKVAEGWENIKAKTREAWENVKATISQKIQAAKDKVTSTASALKSSVTGAWDNLKSKTQSAWESIKAAIERPINRAKDAVKSAIDRMRSFFNFSWSLPHLKLPHLSVSGRFSIRPPSVPHFSIAWYRTGGIMTDPTVFGRAGETALVGGEAGPEAILPLRPFYAHLEEMEKRIGEMIRSMKTVVYVVNQLDGDDLAAHVQTKVSDGLANDRRRLR